MPSKPNQRVLLRQSFASKVEFLWRSLPVTLISVVVVAYLIWTVLRCLDHGETHRLGFYLVQFLMVSLTYRMWPTWYWFKDDGIWILTPAPRGKSRDCVISADEIAAWRPSSWRKGPAILIRNRDGDELSLAYSQSQRATEAEGAVFDWLDARAGRLWYPADDE